MKRSQFIFFLLATLLLFTLPSCHEEGADLRPGLYVNTELIDAFPSKAISISGQASCYTGLQSLSITCAPWGINEVTDLSDQKPVVWNFEYAFVVPTDATFPQDLLITATDVHGTQMKRIITMRYAPSTTAPYIDGLKQQIAVNFDEATGQGECHLKATLYGEDLLKQVTIAIPGVNFSQSTDLNSREYAIEWNYTFTTLGTYPMTITLSDNSGNTTISEHKLIVMKPEVLDTISDYPYLWAFMANANEEDYVFGYYQYVNRQDSYQYQVLVYAESDETAFYFSPTQQTNGERLFGESPLVAERIISVQSQPGYVQGYKPGKGYWGLWIDLKEATIKKWALDNSEAQKLPLYHSADWNGWGFSPMNAGATEFQQTADITIYAGNSYFCLATATDWTNIWRCWNADGGELAGWWFSEDGSGSGASLPTITTDTEATLIFDTAIPWCWIIKK